MNKQTGITVDVSSISKGFYQARKQIREAIQRALEKSGPKVVKSAKAKAPKLRNRLKPSLTFEVNYNKGETSLSITTKDARVNKYLLPREDGPHPDGYITKPEYPNLVFVPRFSPFWSKTTENLAAGKAVARSRGYKYFFQPEGSKVILGVKRTRVGSEYALVGIATPQVYQEGRPFMKPAFQENMQDIQKRIIDELTKIFGKN